MLHALVWALATLPALAGSAEEWSSTYDARLSQALGANPSEAIAVYEALVAQIPASHDQRGEVLYWLGRARWSAGDLAGAKRSLESARGYFSSRARARGLLGRMDLKERAIHDLPFKQDFRLSTDPWVRGWDRGQASDLSVIDGETGRMARWKTEVVPGVEDFLSMQFDTDGAKVRTVSMDLRTESLPAKVRVVLEDEEGRRWLSPVKTVGSGQWVNLQLSLSMFSDETNPGSSAAPSGESLAFLVLLDQTAVLTAQEGDNAIFVDNLVVR